MYTTSFVIREVALAMRYVMALVCGPDCDEE